MQRGRLPGHGGQVVLPSLFLAAHLSDFFPSGLSARCLAMFLFGHGATEKKQSEVIHMPRLWSWQRRDCLPEKTDRPVWGLHWPMLYL